MPSRPHSLMGPLTLVPLAAFALILGPGPGPSPNPAVAASPDVHLRLDRSAPEADATVASPAELRLWFSQVPQAGATSARLIHGGEPMDALGELTSHPEDGSVFSAPVKEALAPGVYTVSWRTMAADGHVVRGDFDFTVRAPRAPGRWADPETGPV